MIVKILTCFADKFTKLDAKHIFSPETGVASHPRNLHQKFLEFF